ncbi:putative T6SS immunity periplasmic lipoprotein [Brenneria tiliae]|uniref:DUF7480 domain-containing protein n=1 Tax=Brenneria tiliae TaxID=2914984 RepID=A0ABT0MXL0_9GAMM|nr:putative T6SS immunity periplasmic lipoprotein [Brenneria tiliae]MCL2894307.1 hypothetical protein [Brenneria tiliae]
MKKLILVVLSTALSGCMVDNSPYRGAQISLAANGQPCVTVSKDSLTSEGKSKLLVLRVSARFPDNNMQQVWVRDDMSNPMLTVQPGECLPIDYHFEKSKEYSVSAITAFSASEVGTKRIWSVGFTLDDLAKK